MAIDTVGLCSPPISEALAAQIERVCKRRQTVDLASGNIEWEITTASLEGTWDSRVSVQIKRTHWVSPSAYLSSESLTGETISRRRRRSSPPIELPCEPYLKVEGSVHKAVMGHNVYGGPLNFPLSCSWFLSELAGRLGVELPAAHLWHVDRVDWAEVFDLRSFEAVQEYISAMNMAEYPRRQVHRYGSSGLYVPGSTTADKVYHKGVEFAKHDAKKLRKHFFDRELDCLLAAEIIGLQDLANRIMRVEVEIRSRKLEADFGHKPSVGEVTQEYLESVWDVDITRLSKEAKITMETVRTHRAVSRRLHQVYDQRLANILLGVWIQLSAVGEKEVRRNTAARTFYRQRKQLVEAGCSWTGTDVSLVKTSAIPVGFSLARSDPRRLLGESQQVRDILADHARSDAWLGGVWGSAGCSPVAAREVASV